LKPVALVGRTSAGTWRQFRVRNGGGGGGTRSDTEASLGRLPRAPAPVHTAGGGIREPESAIAHEPTLVMASEIALPTIDLPRSAIPNGVAGRLGGRGSAAALATAKTAAWGTAGVRATVRAGGGGVTGGGGGFVGDVTQRFCCGRSNPNTPTKRAARRSKARWSCTSKWTRAARRKTSREQRPGAGSG